MSIFFKARSGKFTSSIGILLIRLSIGLLFLFSGASKVLHLQDFIKSVQDSGQMGDSLAFILAFILPFMEMIFGALYIIGLFTPITSFFLACMSISFLYVLGTGHNELPYSYNFVFLACALSTLFTGAGLISFDALADRNKEERKINVIKDASIEPIIFDAGKIHETETIYVDKDGVKSSDVKG
ncbi:MAG: DoxX family protein [Ignavibacteria bacterium]